MNKAPPAYDARTAVAVIGLAGRFPGAATVAAFWELLCQGREAIRDLNLEELRAAGVSAEVLRDPRYVRRASTLADVAGFDAAFFEFSPREAALLDPQQRLFLECAWEALESAGYDPYRSPASIGVFAGAGGSISSYFLAHSDVFRPWLGATGSLHHLSNDKDYLASRVSYKLDLRGPSVTVQTACSTSLVAVHLACQSILAGESDLALAGGVTVRVPQHTGYRADEGGILSPDGRCRAFDARAAGTVFGSGVGVVVLKSLARALDEGDTILAVIRGSAINNDGAGKVSYTASSQPGQARAIAEALAVAGVSPDSIGYVEAHGTATTLGDPLEVAALAEVFAAGSRRKQFCALGSLKTNVGHLEAAAGIAGLIKTVLALQHAQVPPSLHFERPNPRIDFPATPFFVNTRLRSWPVEGVRRAGVNSLGIGGTNAFVVLEEAPPMRSRAVETTRPCHLFCLSARTAPALRELAERYADHLDNEDDTRMADICFTANTGRARWNHRLAGVVENRGQLVEALRDWLAGRHGRLLHGVVDAGQPPSESLPRNPNPPDSEWTAELHRLAACFVAGVDFQAKALGPGRRVPLPTYPFQRQRHWIDAPSPGERSPAAPRRGGSRLHSPALTAQVFETTVGRRETPLVADHRLHGTIVVPGAWHLATVLAAVAPLYPRGVTLSEIEFRHAALLGEDDARILQTIVRNEDRPSWEVVSRSAADPDRWITHALGTLATAEPLPDAAFDQVQAVQWRCRSIDGPAYYEQTALAGYHLGPGFRWLTRVWLGDGEAVGRVAAPTPDAVADDDLLSPGLIDACFQLSLAVFPGGLAALAADKELYVPVAVPRIHGPSIRPDGPLFLHAVRAPGGSTDLGEVVVCDVCLFDSTGRTIARLDGLRMKRAPRAVLFRSLDRTSGAGTWTVEWRSHPAVSADPDRLAGRWLIFPDRTGVAERLGDHLSGVGGRCTILPSRDCPDEEVRRRVKKFLADRSEPVAGVVDLHNRTADITTQPDEEREDAGCRGTLALAQALLEGAATVPLWLVTCGAQPAGPDAAAASIWGLGRALAWEYPGRCVRVDLDPEQSTEDQAKLLAGELAADLGEDEISYRDGQRRVGRLVSLAVSEAEEGRWAIGERGTIDHLEWRPARRRPPGPGEVEIEVRAVGLNFRDVLNVLGTYPGDAGPLGLECAGIVVAVGSEAAPWRIGDEVVGLAWGALASHVTTRADLIALKPATMTFAEAATIPVTFLTAVEMLQERARLKSSDRVLIHAAAGGVGQAALQLAQRAGAMVFATAGTPEKRAFLAAQGVPHVFDSRSLAFADDVRQKTGGRGLDVVLNSLAGEFVPASLALLAPGGWFLELGKNNVWNGERLAREAPAIRHETFDLVDQAKALPIEVGGRLRALLARFDSGELRPVRYRVFSLADARTAFRFMAQARHVGKVVLTPTPAPQLRGTHLVTGGLGGLGRRLATWLADHGAERVVLLGRRLPSAVTLEESLVALQQQGRLEIVTADVADQSGLADVLRSLAASGPPLRGVFHLAGVLDDAMLPQQTGKRLARVLRAKALGAWRLHELTRELPLDHFVLFSSISAVLGWPGQSTYAAANATLDGLAQYRRTLGLPALSINWGPWAEVGMAAALDTLAQQRLATHGLEFLPVSQGLAALGRLLADGAECPPQVVVAALDLARRRGRGPATSLLATAEATREHGRMSPARQRPSADGMAFAERLRVTPAGEQRRLIERLVRDRIGQVLGRDVSAVAPDQPLLALGLDSLIAVEFRNLLQLALDRPLPTMLLFEHPTLRTVVDHLCRDLETPAAVPLPPDVATLDGLPDAEVQRLLAAELETLPPEWRQETEKPTHP